MSEPTTHTTDVTTETAETPELPAPESLLAHEYRDYRGGKSLADIVAARSSPGTTGTTEPVSEMATEKAARMRNESGRFTKGEAAKPEVQPAATKAGNPRHDPKARVGELKEEIAALAKVKGETQRERDALATELATLRAERDALKPPAETPAPPAAAKFAFAPFEAWANQAEHAESAYEDYLEERAYARVRHEQQQEQTARDQRDATERVATAWQPFREREAAFKATIPDYDIVIQRSPAANIPLGPWVLDVLQTADHGPALRYYLAQHPKTTREIAGLSPAAAVRKLDALIPSLTAAPTGTTVTTELKTQAQTPFEPVGVSPTASTRSIETVAAKGSAADYRRLREAERR